MKDRCLNTKAKSYSDYGARGITVDPRWATDFLAFLADMGPRPKGTSLDRIDNEKGYRKDNCRWASPKTQANNTRRNKTLTLGGITKTVAEWIDQTGVNENTLRGRVRRGWSPEKALTQPIQHKNAG